MHSAWSRLLDTDDHPVDTTALDTVDQKMLGSRADGHCPLPGTGVILVRGEDATGFLHAQLSNDIAGLAEGRMSLAGYCNPKGRLFAIFHVIHVDDGYLLLANRALVESLVKRLRMFVLRSRVDVTDVSEQYLLMAVTGDRTGPLLEHLGSLPEASADVAEAGDVIAARWFDGSTLLVLAHEDDAAALWQTLERVAPAQPPELWDLLGIRQGIPDITPATSESFVPQQVNLELIGGINFTKGCYPGQEVVARMHYLGKPSRRLYLLTGTGHPETLAPGDRITTGDGTNAGDIVRAVATDTGIELLAVLRTTFADRQDLSVNGLPVGFGELPYPLTVST